MDIESARSCSVFNDVCCVMGSGPSGIVDSPGCRLDIVVDPWDVVDCAGCGSGKGNVQFFTESVGSLRVIDRRSRSFAMKKKQNDYSNQGCHGELG